MGFSKKNFNKIKNLKNLPKLYSYCTNSYNFLINQGFTIYTKRKHDDFLPIKKSNTQYYKIYYSYFFLFKLYSTFLFKNFFYQLNSLITSSSPINNNTNSNNLEKKNSITGLHKILLTFKHNKLTISVTNIYDRYYFSLEVGLLLRFFRHKKSIKKTKSAKVLLFKYLRKVLNVSGLRTFDLIVRGSPKNLPEFIKTLHKPFTHTYKHPFNTSPIDETFKKSKQYMRFSFNQFLFLRTTAFGTLKTKQRGRLKRRIRKKIVKLNNIPD